MTSCVVFISQHYFQCLLVKLPELVIVAMPKKVKENDSKEGAICYDTHFSRVGPSWLAPSFLGSEEVKRQTVVK